MSTIHLSQFGTILNGRERATRDISTLILTSPVETDTTGVLVLNPSYCDQMMQELEAKSLSYTFTGTTTAVTRETIDFCLSLRKT